jgi:hypothetical protein
VPDGLDHNTLYRVPVRVATYASTAMLCKKGKLLAARMPLDLSLTTVCSYL